MRWSVTRTEPQRCVCGSSRVAGGAGCRSSGCNLLLAFSGEGLPVHSLQTAGALQPTSVPAAARFHGDLRGSETLSSAIWVKLCPPFTDMDKSFRCQHLLTFLGGFSEDSIMIIKTSQGNILFIYKIRSLNMLERFKQALIISMQISDRLRKIRFGKRHFKKTKKKINKSKTCRVQTWTYKKHAFMLCTAQCLNWAYIFSGLRVLKQN